MSTYGFHTIHGRAPAIATGVKLANPKLDVWVVTGDGDALSIGGNHLIHVLRRNVGVKILLFNNRIYGLTKGQYSPTSEKGKRTKSTPLGSLDEPFSPIALALGANASFVARSIDIFADHLVEMVERMDRCEGTALLEIYQNCNIFNDGAFKSFTEKDVRQDRVLKLVHGDPLVYGEEGSRRALRLGARLEPESVDVAAVDESSLPRWDEHAPTAALAAALARMSETEMPVPIGVFRDVPRPAFEDDVVGQVDAAAAKRKESIEELLAGVETWDVTAQACG
jgi:2-oxoglutarate ferredoxin oxidoreductase subunit beta